MNWGRAKTILIVMFLAVDIFLLCVLLQTRSDYEQLPKETVQKTVQILQENGIQIRSEVVPKKRTKNQNIMMENTFSNPVQAADLMLGMYEIKLSDEENHEYLFENEEATLKVNNTFFAYNSKKQVVPYGQGERPDIKAVQEQLKRLGFKASEFAVVEGQHSAGLFEGHVIPLYKNKRIYGISMNVKADQEGILTLEGHWFSSAESEGYGNEALLDITAVLVNLIYREDRWPKAIETIESCFYTSGDYLESREISAIPIYVITDQNGKQKYFDARIGNEIE